MNEYSLKTNPHNNQENWKIDGEEKCTFLPKKADANHQPYLVNVWKTMPYIERGLPKNNIPVMLRDTCYCNDQECKPSVAPVIYEQNYRSLYREDNRYFKHRWLTHGMTLKLVPWNGDYDTILVTNKLDPSFCVNCVSEHPNNS
jgi:hypothetical protein